MKNLTNEMKMEALKNAGFDMDKYELTELVVLTPREIEAAKSVVEDKQLDNKKLFRRWVTAQTFRMLNNRSYNCRAGKWEDGWDAYLRNYYSYNYQFTMMLEELRVLNKLEVKDKDTFAERSMFFTKDVIIATCKHYIYSLREYIGKNKFTKTTTVNLVYGESVTQKKMYIKIPKRGEMSVADVDNVFINRLTDVIVQMEYAESYAELYTMLKMFMKHMINLPDNTPKCKYWKDAFKGIGAYETLKNLILFHDVVLRDCTGKADSMTKLTNRLYEYKGEGWRMHAMLKDTINLNNFDLVRSIKAHK